MPRRGPELKRYGLALRGARLAAEETDDALARAALTAMRAFPAAFSTLLAD